MRGFSAREMLSQLPLRMAHGGDALSPSLLRLANGGDVGPWPMPTIIPTTEHSVSYNRAFELNGEAGVQAYYQGLRDAAQAYLADTDAVVGAEAYNLMIESGISTTDLINAGVGEGVLNKVFNLTEDPTIDTFPLTTAESAFLRDPTLLKEAAVRSAAGEDGVASLQAQARDYVAGVLEGGITDAERTEMQRIATTRGITAQDFEATGVDAGILFKGTYCPPGSKMEGQPMPADGNCNPDVTPPPNVCPPGSKLAGQPIPADGNCDPVDVCPPGSKLAGEPIPADGNCNPDVTPTVCPPGTVLAGQPIPADGNCDPTTKTCPVGTRLSGHIIPIADDCDPTTKLCPSGTVLEGQTIPYEDDCDPATKVCESGTKLAGQTVAYGADCDPTTKVCPAGTKKAGETIPFEDDCNAVGIIYCPPETRLGGQPVPADGDCNPPLRCPEGSELAGLPIPTDGECNPSTVPVYCDVGTELEGQLMPANGDCNPTKFTETKVCPAGTELAGQTIATEDSCDPKTVTKPPTVYGTTKVCPTGTARAGETIPIADDCDASLPTTKVCPPGTKLANQTIGIADDCEGPGIYAAGEDALDTTFRESDPRTQATYEETQADGTVVTKDLPGQYTYTPAAKLLPATGSGLSWMPPSVTSRPRSLLSPGAIQQYGGMTSASSRFAQNRRGMDRTILQAFQAADVYDPSAIRDFRQQARAGLFSTDDGAFNDAQFQSAFDTYLSLRPATKVCPAGTARAGQTVAESADCDAAAAAGDTGQRSDSWWSRSSGTPFTDFERSGTGAAETGDTDDIAGTGYFGPITPVDLRYGVPGQFFAKGGPVRKPVKSKPARGMSARSMLAQFANGGEVRDRIPLAETDPLYIHEDPRPMETESALMLRVLGTPAMEETQKKNDARGAPAPDESESLRAHQPRNTAQTESASMLESIMEGAAMIPETVANYFVRPGDKGPASFSMVSPSELGSDIKFLGGAMWEGAKADPLGFAMDILPGIGEIRSAGDVGKFTDMANKAEAEGKPALADMFRQIVTLSAAGAVPLAGMGARATKHSVISAARKAAEEATTTSARMLDEVVVAGARRDMPETGRPVHAADMSPEEFKNVTHNMYGHQGDLKTPQEMVARANRIGPEFQDAIRNITDQLGLVKSETFGIKELPSLLDKLDRGYKLDRVTDPIRTRILINTAEEADEAARMISEIMPVQDRGWQRLGPSGYFDRKLNVLYTSPSGEKLIGEVQITIPRMSEAVTPPKGIGHRLYEVERELIRIYGSEDAIPDTHIRRFNWVRQEMKDMYSEIEASTDPNIVESILLKPEKDLTPIIPTTRARPPPAESTSARGAL